MKSVRSSPAWSTTCIGIEMVLVTLERKAQIYGVNDIACTKIYQVNPSDGSKLCKDVTIALQLYQTRLNAYSDSPNSTNRILYYMMENFCIPEVIGEKIDEDIIHSGQKQGPPGPCYDISLALSNGNMNILLLGNSSNRVIIKYFDTSEVADMD